MCKELVPLLYMLCGGVPWLAGIAIAEGGLQTVLSVMWPPYAWYLFVEHSLILLNFIYS